jgi:F-type H+-transporting ATPase subunit delta
MLKWFPARALEECGKEVILHQETNPELIGGLLVELEGKIYDGSVRTQLENMKQRITREY